VPNSRRQFLIALPAALLAACTAGRRASQAARTAAATTTTQRAAASTTITTTTSPAARGSATFVRHGRTDRPLVAFTFHGSGDVALLDGLLAVAAAHRAPLTIFAVGQWLDANAGLARRILQGGHELANHTYTHPSLGRVAGARVAEEITKCRDALQTHAGTPGTWFRPSGLDVPTPGILAAAGAAGYGTVVGYDVDPRDYQDPGAAAVRTRTAAGIHAGAIVSLHTGHRGTVDALAGMLADASAKGLRPVTVTDLLAS
jgi:peptidoglycan/xylan/chitin deacetylase (PgdA/CDA1 family)